MGSDAHQHLPSGLELFILTGPTAVGKTESALRWAERFGAEILSCDSLLFYRGMDIGTAKPSARDRSRVPHHLIDVAEPSEPWNVHRYLAAAVAEVADIHRRGRRVLVTGGSGFYLKCFWAPVVDPLEIPAEVTRRVKELAAGGPRAVTEELLRADPQAGEVVDLQNPRRVARALERCLTTGQPLRALKKQMDSGPFPFASCTPRICLLEREPGDLHGRIARRVDEMLAAGLIGEVRRLVARGLEQNPSAASAIGYRETIRFLKGELTELDLREEITRNTIRLVKKQRTWFRHQLPAAARTLSLTGRGPLDPEELFANAADPR